MYRRVELLDLLMNTLASLFPQVCTAVLMPHRSVQGRPIFALRIRAGSGTRLRSILIIGGMHAREMMNPDAILELQADLVFAYVNNTGITYGGRSWSNTDIKLMLETQDVWLLPCANPDGREYCFDVDDMWRQNRRDNPGPFEGVDVNRNCDIVWGVTAGFTSCNPMDETYVGPDRFSEPESRNIKDLCDAQGIDVFLDVHSFSELVLYPWGHAPTQTTKPNQNFLSLATGTCAPLQPANHQEYMPSADQQHYQTVARQIVTDIRAVRGRNYTQKPLNQLYATTGTSTDYVYSRHIANAALRKIYGFSFETGPLVLNPNGSPNLPESFHPADPTLIKEDTKAGILSLLQKQDLCAMDFLGATLPGTSSGLERMRKFRDEQLATTDAGRDLIALFERVQLPLLGQVLADESLTSEAMGLLELSARLLENEETVLTTHEVERGLAFLDSLTSRTTSKDLLSDLETVRKQLEDSTDKSVDKILEELAGTSASAVSKKSTRRRPKK